MDQLDVIQLCYLQQEVLEKVLGLCHEDNRRAIREYVSVEDGYAIQLFHIHGTGGTTQGVGNHYHEGKYTEAFIILKGDGKVSLAKVDQNNVPGEVDRYDLKPGTQILIHRRVAHYFELTAGTVMMCMVYGVDAGQAPGVAVKCVISDK